MCRCGRKFSLDEGSMNIATHLGGDGVECLNDLGWKLKWPFVAWN
jgi:hypothetical protein